MKEISNKCHISMWKIVLAVVFAMSFFLLGNHNVFAEEEEAHQYQLHIIGDESGNDYREVEPEESLNFEIVDENGKVQDSTNWTFYAYGLDETNYINEETGEFKAPDFRSYVYVGAYSKEDLDNGVPYFTDIIMVYVGGIGPDDYLYYFTHDEVAKEIVYHDYLYIEPGQSSVFTLNRQLPNGETPSGSEPFPKIRWDNLDEDIAEVVQEGDQWKLNAKDVGVALIIATSEEADFYDIYLVYVGCRSFKNGNKKCNNWLLQKGTKEAKLYESDDDATSTVIPSSVTVTEEDAVNGALDDSYIGTYAVTTIARDAFCSKSMSEITVPKSVTKIEDYALGFYLPDDELFYHQPVKNFVIKGYGKDSAAAKYAVDNGFDYVDLEEKTPETYSFNGTPSKVDLNLYGYNDFSVSWSKVPEATGYYVQYQKSGGSWSKEVAVTDTSYKVANLLAGAQYRFNVTPYVKHDGKIYRGKSKTSAYVYALKKISKPKVSRSSSKKVKVKWTNINGETGYQISKSTKKSKTKIISTIKSSSAKSKKISAKRRRNYYYKVRAYKTVNGKKIYGPWSTAKKYKLK